MASFTDNSQALSQFNPYIQQVPVDDYIAVGLQKQQQYEQGVQRTQAAIDSVASLPVMKAEQKQYLNERMGQLKNSVSKVVGQDFSQGQLVNQIGGLTSQIANDPIIQGAVQSTMKVQGEQQKMETAQAAGKSSVANEYDLNTSINNWLSDGNIKSPFQGSYTPYVDYKDKILSMINKDLKPDEQVQQLPFLMDDAGNVIKKNGAPVFDTVMIQKQSKTLSPEKIQAAINASMTPDVQNQMQIDGRYEYRGVNKQGLKAITDNSYQYRLTQNNDILQGLAAKKLIDQNNPQYQAMLDAQIQDVTNHRDSLLKQYKVDVQSLDQNPEGYKGDLYSQNWQSNLTTGMSYAQNSLTYHDNPFKKAADSDRDYALQAAKFQDEHNYRIEELKYKGQELELKKYEADLKAYEQGLKSGVGGQTGGLNPLLGPATFEPIDTGALPEVNKETYDATTADIDRGIQGKKLLTMSTLFPDLMTTTIEQGQSTPTLTYKDKASQQKAEASLKMLEEAYANHPERVPTVAREFFDANANAQKAIAARNAGLVDLGNIADNTVNPKEIFNGRSGLLISSPTNEFKPTHIAPTDIADFSRKLNNLITTYLPGTNSAERAAKEQFPDPAQYQMYKAYSKRATGQPLNGADRMILDKIDEFAPLVDKNQEKLQQRSNIINAGLQNMYKVKQPTAFDLESSKPANKAKLESVVGTLVSGYASQTAGTLPGGSDIGTIGKMYKLPTTRFQLEKTTAGGTNIVMTNPEVTGAAQRIPITSQQAEQYFPGSNLNQLSYIDEGLSLTANRGTPTTDVTRQGAQSAFILNNQNLNNYGVKYHVEEPFRDGRYQLKLYISPKGAEVGKWTEKDAQLPSLLTRNELTQYLALFGDAQIDRLLHPPTTQP